MVNKLEIIKKELEELGVSYSIEYYPSVIEIEVDYDQFNSYKHRNEDCTECMRSNALCYSCLYDRYLTEIFMLTEKYDLEMVEHDDDLHLFINVKLGKIEEIMNWLNKHGLKYAIIHEPYNDEICCTTLYIPKNHLKELKEIKDLVSTYGISYKEDLEKNRIILRN